MAPAPIIALSLVVMGVIVAIYAPQYLAAALSKIKEIVDSDADPKQVAIAVFVSLLMVIAIYYGARTYILGGEGADVGQRMWDMFLSIFE